MSGKREEGPDQPRSWAIALAACVINALLSGISRTTGLFYVALIETYGVSRLQANLPFTVRNIVRNLSGPLVGAIGQRYGPRDVTIIGGVFASLGIILCTFAPNVTWITILWGGMHGFGVALGNTLFQVIVNQYFLKHRATASGLALSGACLGSFVLPVLLEYMLANYGLAGAFLVSGGLIMHVLPASIMMVEPPWTRRRTAKDTAQLKTLTRKAAKPPQVMSMIQEESHGHAEDCKEVSVRDFKKISSSDNLEKDARGNSVVSSVNGIDNPTYVGSRLDVSEKKNIELPVQPEEEQDTIPRGRLRTISFGEVSVTIPVNNQLQETSLSRGIMTVLRDPMFHMISLSLASFAMVFDPSITVIVDYFMDKGLKEDVAKYFISMMSLGDLIGRVGFGWVTDRNYMSVPHFMMLIQVSLGVSTLLLPVFNSFDALMTVVVIYGLLGGAILVMFPILVAKYLQSVQSLAIGFVSFFTGIISFGVPPVIGYFRDRIGSYDGMFYITGGMSVVIGFFWLFEPLLMRLGTRLRREESPSIVINS